MYKKTLLTIALVAVFAVPSVSSASLIDDLLAQIQSLLRMVSSLQQQLNTIQSTPATINPIFITPSISTCPALGRDLYIGLRGNDVSSLQAFLRSEGAYTYPSITGYYGSVTQNAVASWQSIHGPISYGTPSTTGFGAVGPVTRSIIAQACAGTTPGVGNPIVCTLEYAPVCGRVGSVDKTYSNLCQLRGINATLLHKGACGANVITPTPVTGAPSTCRAWYDGCNNCFRIYVGGPLACTQKMCVWKGKSKCEEYFQTDSAPSIRGFSGPTTLRTNQTGTWTINASDSLGGNLTYKIDWGENTYFSAYDSILGFIRSNFVQSTTFTHSYTSVGTYTIKITVRNSSGREAQTSTTVQVGTSVVTGVLSATPASGRSPLEVTFSANVGGYTPYRHYIDFGDGTAQADISCYAPADYCQSPGVVKHTYAIGGTYVATLYKRLRSYSLSATAVSTARISVVGRKACPMDYAPVCGLPVYACPYGATCQQPLKQTYGNMCGLNSGGAKFLYDGMCENQWISNTLNITNPAGSTYSLGDDIRVWWNATVGASDVGMYLILEDAVTGQKFKSIKVDYQTGRATISTSDYCNEFFSDGLDAGCSLLTTNVINKAQLKYKIRGAIYTPKDACFGFCTPGLKTDQTLVEDLSAEFTIRGN